MKLETLSLTVAALAPAAGPVIVTLLGYDVPVLSAGVAAIGVVLAFEIAPAPPRPFTGFQRMALRVLAILLVLALVIYDQSNPLISLSWAIGVGMSAYTVMELLGALIPERLKRVISALFGTSESHPESQSSEEQS